MARTQKTDAGRARRRALRYGANSAALAVLAVAVAVALNLFVGLLDVGVDLTSNKMYTVGDATRALLAGLECDIEIIGLFNELEITKSGDDRINDALRMLANYTKSPRVKLRYVDPDMNPGTINELDPEGKLGLEKNCFVVRRAPADGQQKARMVTLGELFEFEYDQRTFTSYLAGMNAEEAFSGAIKYVASDLTPTVYFVTGHGELDMETYFSQLAAQLMRNNFEVGSVSLASAPAVPEEAELLVFASPVRDLLAQELDVLLEYFGNGGKAMLLFDYDEAGAELPNFGRALEEFNVAVNNDKVRENDQSHQVFGDPYFVFYEVGASGVVPAATQMLLYGSRSVSVLRNDKEWIAAQSFVQTTGAGASEPVAASGAARDGPLDIAVAVENNGGPAQSKAVVMGNASFIADQASSIYGQYYAYNIDVFLDALNWLVGEADSLVIPAKSYAAPRVTMTTSQLQAVRLGLLVALPLLVLGAGFAVFMRRRHL